MKVTVKTIWGPGLISIPTVYVNQAKDRGEDLQVECKGARATIPLKDFINKLPRESRFKDKFGRQKEYSLYDFFWKDYLA